MKTKVKGAFLAILAVLLVIGPAHALMFGFSCITDNIADDCAIGEAQLTVDVTDLGGNMVLFTIANSGPEASVVEQVNFEEDGLTSIAINSGSLGVVFTVFTPGPPGPPNPPNLPGGNSLSPPFDTAFAATANSPAPTNGIGPGEFLGIKGNLETGNTFGDLIDELVQGTFRIGVHVIAFEGDGSESFVNRTTPIPEPGTLLLIGSGLVGLGAGARRRKKL